MRRTRNVGPNRSRFTSVLSLVFVLALVLTACGDGDDEPVDEPEEEPEEVPEEEPEGEEEPEEEPEEEEEPMDEPEGEASDYPTDPITFLIGFGAGGGNDLIFRMMAEPMSENLGVNIGVENLPGGGGIVAMTELVGRDPDGYSLVSYQPPSPFISELRGELPFDRNELTMIGAVNQDPCAVAVPGDSEYETLEDLVAAAEEQELTIGHTGVTGMAGLCSLVFRRAAGIELVDVAYESGGEQTAAVLGGEVDMSIRAGGWYDESEEDIRILGIMADEEIDELPGVPTVESVLGEPASLGAIRGLAIQSATDQAIIDRLAEAFEEAANSDDIRDNLLDEVGFRWEYIPMDEVNQIEEDREEIVQELFDAGLLDD